MYPVSSLLKPRKYYTRARARTHTNRFTVLFDKGLRQAIRTVADDRADVKATRERLWGRQPVEDPKLEDPQGSH